MNAQTLKNLFSGEKTSILRLLDLLKPHRGKYLLGLAARVTIATTERMVIAYLAKEVIDAITTQNMPLFRAILINWGLFYVGYALVAPFVIYLWYSAVVEGTANVRQAVFSHLQRLPLGDVRLGAVKTRFLVIPKRETD